MVSRMIINKEKPRMYFKWLSIFRKNAKDLLKFQSKVAKASTSSKKTSNQP